MITNRPVAPNKGEEYPAQPLTPGEVQRLLSACTRGVTGIRNRAMIALLYRSGLRVSELVGLKPTSIDMARHSIRLPKTKSGKAQTRGYLPEADDALARWMDTRATLSLPKGAALFCTLKGEAVSDDYVRVMLHRLAIKAGIDKRVHPHGLRHSFAVELEAAGTPVTKISKLLGHSSIAVTARYLDHLTNAEAIDALQSVSLPPVEAW